MLELKYLTKEFNEKKKKKKRALTNVNITFKNKGLYFILGKSGSGKTTLLNILAGFDTQTSGSYLVEGREFSELSESEKTTFRNKYIGVVFQEYNLLNKYDVYYNVTLPYRISNETIEETKVDDILNKLGILDLKYKKVNELSGGESQRVAIARCLLSETKVILADEPTGALDTTNSEELYKILKEISKEKLVIIVTHDIEAANKYNDHILKIEDGKLEYSDELEERNNLELSKKKRMSFLESFKLGLRLLFTKKFKFILTSLVTILSLFILTYIISILTTDIKSTFYKTMDINNDSYIYISKLEKNNDNHIKSSFFNENEIRELIEVNDGGYSVYDTNLSFGGVMANSSFNYTHEFIDDLEIKLLSGNFPINNNECVISNSFYYSILETDSKYKNYDEIIGQKVKASTIELTITGIYEDGISRNDVKYMLNKNRNVYKIDQYKEKKLHDMVSFYNSIIINSTNDFDVSAILYPTNKDINKIVDICFENSKIYHSSAYYDMLENIKLNDDGSCYIIGLFPFSYVLSLYEEFTEYSYIIFAVFLLILLFSVLMNIRYISYNVLDKQSDIGIVKSLGASKMDLWKIVSAYNIVSIIVNFVCTFIIFLVAIKATNVYFSNYYKFKLSLLNVNLISILSLLFTTVVFSVILTILPLYKLNKKEIKELIKEND